MAPDTGECNHRLLAGLSANFPTGKNVITMAQDVGKGTLTTILVVDDEKTLRGTLEYNLRREGYRVLTAADGNEAIRLAYGDLPDLIILDIMLPGMSGFDVCRAVRKQLTMPILMLSARMWFRRTAAISGPRACREKGRRFRSRCPLLLPRRVADVLLSPLNMVPPGVVN